MNSRTVIEEPMAPPSDPSYTYFCIETASAPGI